MKTKVETKELEEYLRKIEHYIERDPTMNWWEDDETPVSLELEEGKTVNLKRNRIFGLMDEAYGTEPDNKDEEQFKTFLEEREKKAY